MMQKPFYEFPQQLHKGQGKFWLQENGTAMDTKNACSYADIVAEEIDKNVLASHTIYPELMSWFRFCDNKFVLWRRTVESLLRET